MAKKYSDSELAAILEKELKQALGSPTSEVAQLRLRNLQYYKAEATGELAPPSIPDRSQIVASDVADTVEWMLPSLIRVFAASPDAVECTPTAERFAPQAKLASEYMRHCFWKKNDGFGVLNSMFRDALVQKVGFVKVYWEESRRDIEESYKQLTAEQVEEMLEDDDVEVLEKEVQTVQIEAPEMPGMPEQPPMQIEVYDLKVKREKVEDRCVVKCVPPEEMRVHPRARYGEDPLFVAHEFYRTRAELEADGYDLTNTSTEDSWNIEEIERANTQTPFFYDASDGELQRYKCSECYIKLDQDGDGIPEWLRVFMIGKTVMEQEKVPDHPFVWFCPIPLPHTFFGLCPADMAIEPQRLRTSLMRAILDNVYLSVNQRTAVVEGQVNLDDLLMSRPGGVVRVKTQGAMVPVPQNGLDQSAWQMVEWSEQWRETRTGYTRYSQGMSPDALNPTATGVSLIAEKADQRTELIARVAAESVRKIFGKMLACMCRYQEVEEIVELMGKWVPIDPREWDEGYQITVNAGLGTGSKDKKAIVLQQIMQMQAPMAQAGVISPQAVILAARKFVDASGLQGAEELFPDAQQPQPHQDPKMMQAQAQMQHDAQQAQLQMQADQASKQSELQLEHERMTMQAQVDTNRQHVEAQQKQAEAQLQMQLEQYKADQQMQIRTQEIEFERWKAQLQAETQIYIAQMSQGNAAPVDTAGGQDLTSALAVSIDGFRAAVEQMGKPKQIIRGPDGRAAGIA
jgi:hypothetical protein